MINRELIRVKVVQMVYAHLQNPERTLGSTQSEFAISLNKTYDLYHYILTLLVEVRRMAERKEDARLAHAQRLGLPFEGETADALLANNPLLLQLESNKALQHFCEHIKNAWNDEDVVVKKLYNAFVEHDIFKQYAAKAKRTYNDDNEVIRRLYKNVVCNSDIFDASIEENGLYWNDDKVNIDPFVLKTLNLFTEDSTPELELLPDFADESDREFANKLLAQAILRGEEFQTYIKQQTKGWDFERLALMDVVVIQTALAEILTFNEIPVGVSINEYVEIAKAYNTPRSAGFINGMLDTIVKRLSEEGVLLKAIKRGKK
ncbi:MAG: transcription antitermination factor NusB [Bacteroidaceae bacterium]|nr:transcription antitermination factor NusB [Bacteroidaceae bacterium]